MHSSTNRLTHKISFFVEYLGGPRRALITALVNLILIPSTIWLIDHFLPEFWRIYVWVLPLNLPQMVFAAAGGAAYASSNIAGGKERYLAKLKRAEHWFWRFYFGTAITIILFGILDTPLQPRMWLAKCIDIYVLYLMVRSLKLHLPGNPVGKGPSSQLSAKAQTTRTRVMRTLDAIGLLFPPKFRNQIYTPIIEEDKADFLNALHVYRTRRGRAWVVFCFVLRCIQRIAHLTVVSGCASVLAIFSPWIKRWLKY
jgi:hypothetical protein